MIPRPVLVLGPDEQFRAAGLGERLPVLRAERRRFPDGEQLVIVPGATSLDGARVLAVQSTTAPHDERLETLYQLTDICLEYAASVDCALPYLAYARQDRRTPGTALSGPLHLRLLGALGVGKVLIVERHSTALRADGIEVVDVDVSHLLAGPLREQCLPADVVLSPDAGGSDRAARLARLLGLPHRALHKTKNEDHTWYPELPASLAGCAAIVVDDLCTTGSTLVPLLAGLAELGCAVRGVAVTHVPADPRVIRARLPGSPPLVFTDSAGPHPDAIPVLPTVLNTWLAQPVPAA